MNWLTEHKIPLGHWMRLAVDWLNEHAAFVFYAISDGLGAMIGAVTDLLLWAHPLALIGLFAALAWWLHRSWRLVALIVPALLLIVNLGYWAATMETLALVLFATAMCMAVGVPLGIAAAHRPWLYQVLRPVLDLTQTIPTFVYLIPTLILFGLGVVPGLISTVIFAVAAPVRLTHLGISSTPRPLLEAGESFGASRRQLLWKIELPHAMPAIMAGLTQCIMLSLSMVVIAALVGAGGLGKPVVRALNTVNIGMGFEAGLAIVILAIVMDRVFKQPERKR
ncbi:choline ABC transporter permease subunit [Azospirillum halopraeferens]|uniref:choline ABC transporter permease subunit n=1 Tax=Azospirillum halopraeferens TaxID=34010 RepID=UPI000427F618|nr:choline ABC transporter permease subunit [Azospirillum halopraeferens]